MRRLDRGGERTTQESYEMMVDATLLRSVVTPSCLHAL